MPRVHAKCHTPRTDNRQHAISPNDYALSSGVVHSETSKRQEDFEDIKGCNRIRKSKNRKHSSQTEKGKQQSTKHYIKN